MSQENVEIVRRAYEAFTRGGVEAAEAFLHPEVVWSPISPESAEVATEHGKITFVVRLGCAAL